MVVTQQGCWTKHIHNHIRWSFHVEMSTCVLQNWALERSTFTKRRNGQLPVKRSTKKAELKKHLQVQCLICNYVNQSLGINLCVKNFSPEPLLQFSQSLLLDWVRERTCWCCPLPQEKGGYHDVLLHSQPGAPHHKETWKIIFTFFEISLSSLGTMYPQQKNNGSPFPGKRSGLSKVGTWVTLPPRGIGIILLSIIAGFSVASLILKPWSKMTKWSEINQSSYRDVTMEDGKMESTSSIG